MNRRRSRANVIYHTFVVALAAMAIVCSGLHDRNTIRAEEPYRQFLEKLNESGLHNLALVYLNDLEKGGSADPQFVKEIPLERAILLQAAASKMPARSPGRAKRLDEAEKALQSFLDTNKEHLRRGEARLGLGNLLVARAEEAKGDADGKADVPDAIKYYGEAEKVFASTQAELKAVLETMQGARVNADDEAGKALRERLQADYRRAELLNAFSMEQKGRSYAAGSPPWKKSLEEAQQAYTTFYEHEKKRQEARNIALFYRSGIQRDFGVANAAADGYNRIVDEEIDELRPLQFKSLTELIKLWGTKEQDKFPAVLELINKWEKQIRPDERSSQDVIDFQLAAVKAKMEFALLLQSKNPDDRNVAKLRKDVREDLLRVIKITGPHQQAARELLAQYGLGKERTNEVVEIPKVKSFDEAIKEASSRFETLQNELVTQQTLQDTLAKETDEGKKKSIIEQLNATSETINRLRDQSGELYATGIRMFPQGGEISQLNDARYRLAYIQLERGNPRGAIAIGEFLSQTLAGNSTGLQAATVALAGYGKLISDADLETQGRIANQLQPFAEFMVTSWPDSTQAQAAASTLVQLAMNAGDIDKARSYIDKLPGGSGKAGALKRDLGARLAAEFFQEKFKLGAGAEVPAPLVTKRDAAIEVLQAGLNGLTKNDMDARALDAINSLVRLYLSVGKVKEAVAWTQHKELAPVALLRSKAINVDQNLTKLDSYRTALQVAISLLGNTTGEPADPKTQSPDVILKEIEKLVGELREAAGSDSEGNKRLTGIFVSVASEVQDMIDAAKSPEIKQKLADGLVLLCKQVAASSEEFNTRFWAGRELGNVAAKLDASSGKTKLIMVQESTKLLEAILDKEAEKPGWIDVPNGAISVRVTLAQSMRQAGQYQQALDQLTKVLAEKETALPLQIAAAEIYQAWGDSGVAERYEQALNGALNNNRGGRVIWGWKGMSKNLQDRVKSDPNFKEPFINARYNVSLVLYRHALADAGQKDDLLGKAAREIGSTRFLMPDMGGPENFKKFDALLKNIEKAQGKEVVGLKTK